MSNFRVKEVALNKDGTNVWFYPELLVKRKVITGRLWWKKEINTEEWQRFYPRYDSSFIYAFSLKEIENFTIKEKEGVIAFRTLDEAEKWYRNYVEQHRKKNKEENEQWYRFLGAELIDEAKIHELEIK